MPFCGAFIALVVATLRCPDARADKTTLGVEWEIPSHAVDMTNTGTFAVKKDGRILCTPGRIGAGYPLVSVTFDMSWPGNSEAPAGADFRTIEIVTGPIDSDDTTSWNAVKTFVARFYDTVRAQCDVTAREDGTTAKRTWRFCRVNAGAVLTAMNRAVAGSATNACYDDATKNIPTTELNQTEFALLLDQVRSGETPPSTEALATATKTSITEGLNKASTQVSLGIDVETFGSADLSTLYADKSAPGFAAYSFFRDHPTVTAYDSGKTRGLVLLRLIAASLHFQFKDSVFFEKYRGSPHIGTAKLFMDDPRTTTPLVKGDWQIKNWFGLLPKTRTSRIFGSKCQDGFQSFDGESIQASHLCSQFDPADPKNSGEAKELAKDPHRLARCLAFMEVAPSTFPIDAITHEAPPLCTMDNKLRVVFEMRIDKTRDSLIAHRGFKAQYTGTAPLALDYAGTITLPSGLPTTSDARLCPEARMRKVDEVPLYSELVRGGMTGQQARSTLDALIAQRAIWNPIYDACAAHNQYK